MPDMPRALACRRTGVAGTTFLADEHLSGTRSASLMTFLLAFAWLGKYLVLASLLSFIAGSQEIFVEIPWHRRVHVNPHLAVLRVPEGFHGRTETHRLRERLLEAGHRGRQQGHRIRAAEAAPSLWK